MQFSLMYVRFLQNMVSITLLTLGSKNMILAYVRKVFAESGFYCSAYFKVQKFDFC